MRVAYRGLFSAEELARIDPLDRANRWRDHVTGGSSTTLLAETDGQPVGFVDFGVSRDEDLAPGSFGEVMAVYVRPEAWGRGVGRLLTREALDRLQSDGMDPVVLWVIEANRRAVGFYERLGFVRDGAIRHREMFGTPSTVVRFRRPAVGKIAEPAASLDRCQIRCW
jgi:ribosomal protein S18 acetylase RimI-like enzyme